MGMNRRKLLEFLTCFKGSSSAYDHCHHTPDHDHVDIQLEEDVLRLPRRFEYKKLRYSTNRFKNIIRRMNSFDVYTVFKGTMIDRSGVHMEVEVKRIESRGGDRESEAQFAREVIASASLQHVNIAHFIGYCYDPSRHHRYLVHKFYKNCSLDEWLFVGERGILSWDLRYRTAIDIATALRYLHDDCYDKIIHNNVKMSNILLDEDFRAHLTGFGLSHLMDKDEQVVNIVKEVDHSVSHYWPPEYFRPFHTGRDSGMNISEQVDVYAYGVVLLEIVQGEMNVGGQQKLNLATVWELLSRHGDVAEVVDKRLLRQQEGTEINIDKEQVRLVLTVALWCTQHYPERRPSMARVVAMLQGKSAVDIPPKTRLSAMNMLTDYKLDHELEKLLERSTINLKPTPTLERAAIRRLFPPRTPENGVGTSSAIII